MKTIAPNLKTTKRRSASSDSEKSDNGNHQQQPESIENAEAALNFLKPERPVKYRKIVDTTGSVVSNRFECLADEMSEEGSDEEPASRRPTARSAQAKAAMSSKQTLKPPPIYAYKLSLKEAIALLTNNKIPKSNFLVSIRDSNSVRISTTFIEAYNSAINILKEKKGVLYVHPKALET